MELAWILRGGGKKKEREMSERAGAWIPLAGGTVSRHGCVFECGEPVMDDHVCCSL